MVIANMANIYMLIWMYFAFINLLRQSFNLQLGFGSNILVLSNLHKRPWTTNHRTYSDGVCMSKVRTKGHTCVQAHTVKGSKWAHTVKGSKCVSMHHSVSCLPTSVYTDVSHRQILYIFINLARAHTHAHVDNAHPQVRLSSCILQW